jgi:DNA-binding transcriptional LysR family regulator
MIRNEGRHFSKLTSRGLCEPDSRPESKENQPIAAGRSQGAQRPVLAELRVFLAVAKAKSFNRAGDELHISRQTISRDILRLQDQLGAVLLIPSKSGVQLTERGKELADKLLSLDQILFSMSNDLRAESREAEGNVRITATEALTGFFIVPSAVEFTQRYPKIRTHLRNPSTC